ncbi:hypothetical protein [Aeromicrobium sp. 179-A 4D2 NHS]|uniref:hypothetical protein n=1 Tax=Aeromicrobium sp. 179-A 4D2 NHS TaxID=3142375 RepID=UPI0039A252AB
MWGFVAIGFAGVVTVAAFVAYVHLRREVDAVLVAAQRAEADAHETVTLARKVAEGSRLHVQAEQAAAELSASAATFREKVDVMFSGS